MEFNFDKKEEKEVKKTINFQELPSNAQSILNKEQKEEELNEKYMKEESVGIPYDDNQQQTHLGLILNANLRDLELMIRGLEYRKRYNPLTKKEEIILRKIEGHPLNEYGINKIMNELRVYSNAEIKLGRKTERDHYNSVQHVCNSITRLIYKNLKSFGMSTQEQQRSAKTFCNAIIEIVDASFSRSIGGRENDLSRPTNFDVQSSIDNMTESMKVLSKQKKEEMKN